MQSFICWVFILATTLSTLHEVNSKDDNIIEILFVNDMQYGFYPIDAETGEACLDDVLKNCKGGISRLVKALEISYPFPTTTTSTTQSTSTTESTSTTQSTSTTESTSTTQSTSTTTAHNARNAETLPVTTSPKPKSTHKDTAEEVGEGISVYNASENIDLPNNTLILNAGNYLHSNTNNWFDLLKYNPAAEALNSLPFSAIAIGPDVLQYGQRLATDFASKVKFLAANVKKSSGEDFKKSMSFTISGVKVTVIGFLGKFDKEKYYGGISISSATTAIEAEIKEQKSKGNHIFVAIGTADADLAKEIAKIEGMNIVIYSGGNNITEDVVLEKVTESSWIATSRPPAAMEPHGLIGNITIQINDKFEIVTVQKNQIPYKDGDKAVDEDIMKLEKDGHDEIHDKIKPLAKTQVPLGGDESCNSLEYGLGDLVTDAMKRFTGDNDYEDSIAMWNPQNHPLLIKENKEFSQEDIYASLGQGKDENMYLVPLLPKKIASLLEESIDNLDKKDCSSLQISGLYVDYASWESKGKRIKRIRWLTGKGLQDLNLEEGKELKVVVPSHLMKKLNLSSALEISDLGKSVADAVVDHINKTMYKNSLLSPSPVGLRFVDVKPAPKTQKCQDNVGEAVILTLAVVVMIGALGLLTWYVIIPRIRQRRGSTIPLIY